MPGLTAYGHSWIQGDGASRPACRLVDVAAGRLGCAPTNLGTGGSSTTDVADLVRRRPPPPAELYLMMTGLNDARLHGTSPGALQAYSDALRAILAALHRANPAALTIAIEQPYLADYAGYPPHNRGSHAGIDAYNHALRAVVAGRPGSVPAVTTGWDPSTMLAPDTVHPNDAGHAELAAAVVDAVTAARVPGRRP